MSRAYYNEFDPKAAAWLRELIKAGLIADGDVDERSIAEVSPSDLTPYAQCHFFAGIGGWSYALRLAGVPDGFPVWTGSCPCQPFSAAGKGLGEADERHLWPVFRGLIRACNPSVVFGEQVASKAGRVWLSGVFADLEGMDYQRAGADLCAAGVGAPHIRQRLYWMAYSGHLRGRNWAESEGQEQHEASGCRKGLGWMGNPECEGLEGYGERGSVNSSHDQTGRADDSSSSGSACGVVNSNSPKGERLGPVGVSLESEQEAGRSCYANPWKEYSVIGCSDGKSRRIESGSFPLADGFPGRLGLLRGYGNAIVPQVAAEFISASLEAIQDLKAA